MQHCKERIWKTKLPASTLKCQATKEMALHDFAVPIGGPELEVSGFAPLCPCQRDLICLLKKTGCIYFFPVSYFACHVAFDYLQRLLIVTAFPDG
jgi:hypothetical protein